jgi:hypothetical protein
MGLDGLDGLDIDIVAQRTRRMKDRTIDPGSRHLRQRFLDQEVVDLTMMTAHAPIAPDVYLRIDDLHSLPP